MTIAVEDDRTHQSPDASSGNKSPVFPEVPESFGRGEPAARENPHKEKYKKSSDDGESDQDGDGEKQPEKKSQGKHGDDDQGKDAKEDKEKQKNKKPFWKRPVLLAVMILVALLLIAGGVVWWLMTRNYESTDDAFIDGHIVQVAPRIAGHVLSLNVEDNQFVQADTVVIDLDPAPFQATYDNALAAVLQAQAKLQQSQADVVVQQANANQARADVQAELATCENAELDYARYHALPVAARVEQQVDLSTATYKSDCAQLIAAQDRAASAAAQVLSSTTSVKAALAQVAAANAQLEQAGLDMQYVRVTAGQEGFVTRRTVEKGNYVQVGQELMDIIPKIVWVTANFKETQLRYMRPNQPVTVTIDAYPDHKYRAHVDSVQAGTGAVFSVLPPENATGNFVKIVQRVPVKIIFDDRLDRVLAPGESVDPSVDIRSGR